MLLLLILNLALPILVALLFFAKKLLLLPWIIALNIGTAIFAVVFHLFFFLPIK